MAHFLLMQVSMYIHTWKKWKNLETSFPEASKLRIIMFKTFYFSKSSQILLKKTKKQLKQDLTIW